MYDMVDDNELDRIARQAADGYTPPGHASWDTMERELDQVLPVIEKRKRRFLLWWWMLPGLFLLGIGYRIFTQQGTGEKKTAAWVIQTEKESPGSWLEKKTAAKPVIKPEKTINHSGKDPKKVTPTESEPSKRSKNITRVVVNFAPKEIRKSEREVSPVLPATSPQTALAAIEQQHAAEQIVTSSFTPLINDGDTLKLSALSAPADSSMDIRENEQPLLKKVRPAQKRFSLGLVAGVDLSTVKFRYANRAGINMGLLAGYHFNNKWSLHTGLIYSQKNYKLAGKDYTPPKGSWISNYTIETVTGFCRMWEVPLQVRYTVSNPGNKNQNLFLSTGLSSYFMTRENYDFLYYFQGQAYTRNSNYTSRHKHILSIAHFSAGISQRMSNHISLLIEPYAKLPLVGVGSGSIQLSSFGVNLSAQFRQPVRK